MGQKKRWQVIGTGKQRVFDGTDAEGHPHRYVGGDVFDATEEEVARGQRHNLLEYPVATPPVEPRDIETARVADQDEAQRLRAKRKRVVLDRAMHEPPTAEVM
jgi:hypothetical protein